MHVKSEALVARLRAERNTAREELSSSHKALRLKMRHLASLEKFSGDLQRKSVVLEEEKAEGLTRIDLLTESLKKVEATLTEAQRTAEDAK